LEKSGWIIALEVHPQTDGDQYQMSKQEIILHFQEELFILIVISGITPNIKENKDAGRNS